MQILLIFMTMPESGTVSAYNFSVYKPEVIEYYESSKK